MRELDVAPDGRWAVGPRHARLHLRLQAARRRHLSRQHVHRRAHADAEEPVATSTGSHAFGISPDGNYFLYWKDNKFQAYDLDAGDVRRRSAARRRRASSTWSSTIPGPKPAYGIAGYTQRREGGRSSQHRYDLWLMPLDGSAPTQPDERRRHEERDAVPLRAHRAARADRTAGGGARRAGRRRWRRRRRPRARDDRSRRSRSRSRPTASTRRRPASTSWRTAS